MKKGAGKPKTEKKNAQKGAKQSSTIKVLTSLRSGGSTLPRNPKRGGRDVAGRRSYEGSKNVRQLAKHQLESYTPHSLAEYREKFGTPGISIGSPWKTLGGLGPDLLSEAHQMEAARRLRMNAMGDKANHMNLLRAIKELPSLSEQPRSAPLASSSRYTEYGRNPALGPPPILKPVPIVTHTAVKSVLEEKRELALKARMCPPLGSVPMVLEQVERRIQAVVMNEFELASLWMKFPMGLGRVEYPYSEVEKLIRSVYVPLNNAKAFKVACMRSDVTNSETIHSRDFRGFLVEYAILCKFNAIFGDWEGLGERLMTEENFTSVLARLGPPSIVDEAKHIFEQLDNGSGELPLETFGLWYLDMFGRASLPPFKWPNIDKKNNTIRPNDFVEEEKKKEAAKSTMSPKAVMLAKMASMKFSRKVAIDDQEQILKQLSQDSPRNATPKANSMAHAFQDEPPQINAESLDIKYDPVQKAIENLVNDDEALSSTCGCVTTATFISVFQATSKQFPILQNKSAWINAYKRNISVQGGDDFDTVYKDELGLLLTVAFYYCKLLEAFNETDETKPVTIDQMRVGLKNMGYGLGPMALKKEFSLLDPSDTGQVTLESICDGWLNKKIGKKTQRTNWRAGGL